MPKLPVNESARDSQLLEKENWARGDLAQKKGWVPKFKKPARPMPIQIKLAISLFIVVFALVGVYAVASKFLPDILRQKQSAEVASQLDLPVDITKINFPSEINKKQFVDAIESAKTEKEKAKRYLVLENAFRILLDFYTADHNPDNRLELEKLRDYIKSEYSDKYEQYQDLYVFPCLDALCGEKIYPSEIITIKQEIEAIGTIDPQVKATLFKSFEAAVSISEKEQQGGVYLGVLSMLSAEYERTNDEAVRDVFNSVLDFVKANYPETRIPDEILVP